MVGIDLLDIAVLSLTRTHPQHHSGARPHHSISGPSCGAVAVLREPQFARCRYIGNIAVDEHDRSSTFDQDNEPRESLGAGDANITEDPS